MSALTDKMAIVKSVFIQNFVQEFAHFEVKKGTQEMKFIEFKNKGNFAEIFAKKVIFYEFMLLDEEMKKYREEFKEYEPKFIQELLDYTQNILEGQFEQKPEDFTLPTVDEIMEEIKKNRNY